MALQWQHKFVSIFLKDEIVVGQKIDFDLTPINELALKKPLFVRSFI